MEFWSTGLGRRSMSVDIGKEKISVSEGKVFLTGTVKPPLSWQYTIAMDGNDWVEFLETDFHPAIILYLIKPRKWKILLKATTNLFLFFVKYILFLPKTKIINRRNSSPPSSPEKIPRSKHFK